MIDRKEFEVWAQKQSLSLCYNDGLYESRFTQLCWEAWTEAKLFPVNSNWEAIVKETSDRAFNRLTTLFDEPAVV